MIDLRDVHTGLVVGRISEEQLQFIVDQLEEERPHDRDYHLDEATDALLAEQGADEQLLATLRHALAGRTSIDVDVRQRTARPPAVTRRSQVRSSRQRRRRCRLRPTAAGVEPGTDSTSSAM